MLQTGILVGGGKGCGKSTVFKVVTSEIIRQQPLPIQVKLFDTACVLRWAFEPILRQTIDEKTEFVYSGKKHILYDINLMEPREIQSFISQVCLNDFIKQRDLKIEMEGNLLEWNLYGLEETQSSLSTYALQRKEGKKLLKMISEARNFNQAFIVVGQRLANVSTALTERMQGYLFGRMIGDNDLAKVKRMCGSESGIHKMVKKLPQFGHFIYYNGSSAYKLYCPPYKCTTKPIEWKPKEEDRPTWEWLWGKRLW